MASYLATLASRIAISADAVARSVAPVDDHGASQPTAPARGALASVSSFVERSANDVQYLALHGRAFHLSDIPAYIDLVKNQSAKGIDDRKMLLEKLLVLMSRLPADSEFAQGLEVLTIDVLYKDLPHPPAAYLPRSQSSTHYPSTAFSLSLSTSAANVSSNGHTNGSAVLSSPPYQQPSTGYRQPYAARSADGTGYSTVIKDMGAAGQPYARTVPPATPASVASLPDSGLVFDALLARRPTPKKTDKTREPSSSPTAIPGHTTLPPTDAKGFARQPGGLSSLFFAFADLVIHSVFNTSHAEWGINLASSYLDLSPLYGSNEDQVNKVRRKDGTGRLWNDVFADGRLLFMPPSVPALLIMFNRNHNFIASKLLSINESGSYINDSGGLEAMSDVDREAQDDEIFARTRLINCGWFMQVILGDYVGAILGLVRDGLSWRLDPLAEARELDHSVSPRGEGNVVSLEFNLLYRWHAAISQSDTEWTEKVFEELFQTRDFKSISVNEFQKVIGTKLRPDPDVRKWTFDGADGRKLARDPTTGAFKDVDLATLLQNATSAPAGAFKARGIPEVLRVIEIMGIEQARQWGACTMNEFRKFMGLRPFGTFEEWNSDPDVARTAEMLYGHIDNLELHVGIQAEEAKPPIPGAGLCPGYTISRAILADAVALVRGDRFLTTDLTVYNLTSWGYQDCFPEKNDGAFGGVLTKLLYRALPSYYPSHSSYARFPFMVPDTMKGYLAKLVNSPAKSYTFDRPVLPPPVITARSYATVSLVLRDSKQFSSHSHSKLEELAGFASQVNVFRSINSILSLSNAQGRYSTLLGHLTARLVAEKSVQHPAEPTVRYIDIVREVISLVPVSFAATELLGLPIKTPQTPEGLYRGPELIALFEDVSNFVFFNDDPYRDWVLWEKAKEVKQAFAKVIQSHLDRLSAGAIGRTAQSFRQWYTGEENFSDAFLYRMRTSNVSNETTDIANALFAAILSTAPLYALAIVHVVDFFLQNQGTSPSSLTQAINSESPENDTVIFNYACEALRLNPVRRGDTLFSNGATRLEGVAVQDGQSVYCSFIDANLDTSVFGPNPSNAVFTTDPAGITGLDNLGLTSTAFFKMTAPKVLREILGLKGLQRAPGPSGSLKRVSKTTDGCPDYDYLDLKSRLTPFPSSMLVQYEVDSTLKINIGDSRAHHH